MVQKNCPSIKQKNGPTSMIGINTKEDIFMVFKDKNLFLKKAPNAQVIIPIREPKYLP